MREPGADAFEYRGWRITTKLEGADEVISGRADLHLNGAYKCRLLLASARRDRAGAKLALETKAKDFIDEWHSRDHGGESGFQEL
jgi:hypothetical protein